MTNPHDIIIKPVVTEQSMTEMGNKKYTFIVAKNANKTEVKKAIERFLTLKQERNINYDGKMKRMGRTAGKIVKF